MDVIRKEASILIDKVLEESITILNNQQVPDKRVDFDLLKDTSDICQEPRTVTHATVDLPSDTQKRDEIVDKKFQKLYSQTGCTENSAKAFDLAFDSLIQDDEISSLHQDFSKMSWNESLSATNSMLADLGQNTPDNDIQDILTDTGDEGIPYESSEDLQVELKSVDKDAPPKPTPRIHTLNTEVKVFDSNKENEKELSSLREHEDSLVGELPIPKPRQQKVGLSLVPKENCETVEKIETHSPHFSEPTTEADRSQSETIAEATRVKFSTEPETSDSIPDLPKSVTPPKELVDLSHIIPVVDLGQTDKTSETNLKHFDVDQHSLHEPAEMPSEIKEIALKRCLSLTAACASMENANIANESSVVSQLKECDTDIQTSFYIGELSTNIITKSRPTPLEDDKDVDSADFPEETNVKPEAGSSFATDFKEEPASVAPIQDLKVIRQGSETRNDLLEIEMETQKTTTPELCLTEEPSKVKQDSIELNIVKGDIIKETSSWQQAQTTSVDKKVKLDLLLDKSELEMPEKSSTLPPTKIPVDVAESIKSDNILPDVLLVERTLEEVKQSLDAAKEELIQVVKDGKSIKQSPSEFEFKNISQLKSGLHFTTEVEKRTEEARDFTLLEEIPETSSLHIEKDMHSMEKTADVSFRNATFVAQADDPTGQPESIEGCSFSGVAGPKTVDTQQQSSKAASPVSNRWSLHEVDNSSSSESYYKGSSRPVSSDFETVHTFHTSSEYQTALDASAYKESTEYISAMSTFDNSSKTISSHESMKSLSSEASGNLGSIDASDLSETLIASIGDQDVEIDLESESSDALEDMSMQIQAGFQTDPTESDTQQACMKRSQEMIFTKEATAVTETKSTPSVAAAPEADIFMDDKRLASSLEDSSILSTSSTSAVDTVVQNVESLAGSLGSSSLAGIEMFTSLNDNDNLMFGSPDDNTEIQVKVEARQSDDKEEPRRRGHKRNESTLVDADVIRNLLDDEAEATSYEDLDKGSRILGDDHKGSESESDQDPYESEYSRAFKSPSQRKKRKEKRQTESLEQSPEHSFSPLHLVAQTIMEDIVTEEIESQFTEEERRPSQNMQDYSNIPDITVTEDMIKYVEEADLFPDNTLYKVKTQDELHKVEDRPIQRIVEPSYPTSDEKFNELVQQQYKQKLADLDESERRAPDSPDSFEMVDQPDITDEFVIIEEVAKEASEMDMEGKSIKISSCKIVQKHDEEVEQILIKSAPAATNLGSQIFRDDLNFDFEESPPSAQGQVEMDSAEMAQSKKWVEMQLSEHANQLRYPYELERGVLEDIKEEDAEFEVGSSRISSFKDSFSSTPEYDVLAGRKYFSKTEHDDISMNSLQEFESLEQAISLENRRIYQGSTDSSNGSFTRRYVVRNTGGDDISMSSLKEFEGLENACIEAHLIEIKAKEEAALLLSRSDESNNSNNGNETSQNVMVTTRTRIVTSKPVSKAEIEAILMSKIEEHDYGAMSSTEKSEVTTNKTVTMKSSSTTERNNVPKPDATSSPTDTDNRKPDSHKEQSYILDSTPSTSVHLPPADIPDNISNISNESLNLYIEQTSSTATNATYYNESDSMMSDSMTSCGSSTLIEDSSAAALPTSPSFIQHLDLESNEDKGIFVIPSKP